MSGEHIRTELLHDRADGLLGGEEAARIAAHLAACPACAAEAESIARLRQRVADLPASVDPGVDLRPGIRALRAQRTRGNRAPLAAAAVLVLAAAGLAAALLLRADGVAPAGVPETAAAPADAAEVALALDAAYDRAGDELKARVSFSATGRGAEAARLVAADVAAVERALGESRAALRQDPGSAVLRELVLSAHRQRMDVLRRAAELAAEMEGVS